MKNIIKTGLIAVIAFTPLVNIAQAAFPDVPADHIYYDAINYVQEEGIVSGFSDGTYRPEDPITRAEFTKIITNTIYNLENLVVDYETRTLKGLNKDVYEGSYESCVFNTEVSPGGTIGSTIMKSGFSDVPSKEYYYRLFAPEGSDFARYTCLAKVNGNLNGYPDGAFRPDNSITFGEASKIISNTYEFTDLQSGPEGDVFKPFIDALAERNAIPTTIISTDSELDRGEMAEIIYRLENDITYKSSVKYIDLISTYKDTDKIYKDETVSFRYPENGAVDLQKNELGQIYLINVNFENGNSIEIIDSTSVDRNMGELDRAKDSHYCGSNESVVINGVAIPEDTNYIYRFDEEYLYGLVGSEGIGVGILDSDCSACQCTLYGGGHILFEKDILSLFVSGANDDLGPSSPMMKINCSMENEQDFYGCYYNARKIVSSIQPV